jgi:hypothetical protein
MIKYYGYEPENVVLTLYRLYYNAGGIVTKIEGANATTAWQEMPTLLEALYSDPAFRELSLAEAETIGKRFGVWEQS